METGLALTPMIRQSLFQYFRSSSLREASEVEQGSGNLEHTTVVVSWCLVVLLDMLVLLGVVRCALFCPVGPSVCVTARGAVWAALDTSGGGFCGFIWAVRGESTDLSVVLSVPVFEGVVSCVRWRFVRGAGGEVV